MRKNYPSGSKWENIVGYSRAVQVGNTIEVAGTTAVEAAGKVHTDFARGFIRAETIAFKDLVEHKDEKGAKAAGKVRKEGKAYIVADGDILNILSST